MSRLSASVIAAAALAACLACGDDSGRGRADFPLRDQPLLVAELGGLDPDIALPRSLTLRAEEVARARLSPTGYPADTMRLAESLALDAVAGNYLCMLVDVHLPAVTVHAEARSNIILRTLDSGVAVRPAELSAEMQAGTWGSWLGRQETLAGLMDKYQPDVVIMRLHPSSAGQVQELLRAWSGRDLDMAVYSPPRPGEHYRGWAVLKGPSFSGGRMDGLTMRGLYSTLRAVLGVPDTLRAAEGTAAYGHLRVGNR